MLVTLETSHSEMSWSKADANLNISCMLVTLETSHKEMFWLNAIAEMNIPYMLVTFETSHAEMLELKVPLDLNKSSINVTPETSQLLMSPYFTLASPSLLIQSLTAPCKVSSVKATVASERVNE